MRWNSSSVMAPRSRRLVRRSRSSRGPGVLGVGPRVGGGGAVGDRGVVLGGGVTGAAAVVGLHLAVDLELDRRGRGCWRSGTARLAGRLQQQVAGADHPARTATGRR